jgi:predicted KAP-like P-loop ATPase
MRWFRRGKRRDDPTSAAPVEGAEPAPRNEDPWTDYVSDAPIEDAQHDRFRRWIWACRVAETIAAQRDPASIVVGIYGPWGDGKTSVLNLIYDMLDEAPGVVPVKFNPWRLGDEAEMFQGFFATLADALDERVASTAERVGQTLRDYGGLLVAVPFVGGVLKEGAGAAGARLSETSLAKQRKKIEDLLAEHGQRVVILIDDIDRLDKSEVQAMFRLVKVAADFQHTAYVLAFDHRVVASALAERYAAEPAHGAGFMDKIVQLPLHMPPAPLDQLRAIALEAVDAALSQAGLTLAEVDAAAFVSAFDRAVGPRLQTPRAAKRYGNALLFALPMMGSEVHTVDLMLVEAMRVCDPSLYEWVRSHE